MKDIINLQESPERQHVADTMEALGNGGCAADSIRSNDDVVWKLWQDGAR